MPLQNLYLTCESGERRGSFSSQQVQCEKLQRKEQVTAATPDNYPHDLVRDVVCDGSFSYHLRPIRPDDAAELMAFHSRLTPHSVYLRFFTFHPTLSGPEAERFTHVDYINRLALVAESEAHIIAVGRFDSGPGETEAEVAFVVADEYQHHGIGPLLLDELARAAVARGITTFRAETLCENHAMLDVFHHAGFSVTSTIEFGSVTLRFSIEPTERYRVALAERETRRHLTPAMHPAAPNDAMTQA